MQMYEIIIIALDFDEKKCLGAKMIPLSPTLLLFPFSAMGHPIFSFCGGM